MSPVHRDLPTARSRTGYTFAQILKSHGDHQTDAVLTGGASALTSAQCRVVADALRVSLAEPESAPDSPSAMYLSAGILLAEYPGPVPGEGRLWEVLATGARYGASAVKSASLTGLRAIVDGGMLARAQRALDFLRLVPVEGVSVLDLVEMAALEAMYADSLWARDVARRAEGDSMLAVVIVPHVAPAVRQRLAEHAVRTWPSDGDVLDLLESLKSAGALAREPGLFTPFLTTGRSPVRLHALMLMGRSETEPVAGSRPPGSAPVR